MAPSREYRDYLRGVRMFLEPKHVRALAGKTVSELEMGDLEALFFWVFGADPRPMAPKNYRCRH